MVKSFDVIVVGAGHSGIEAGLASARRGAHTLMLTINLDNIAFMPCNPSVGGPRERDCRARNRCARWTNGENNR